MKAYYFDNVEGDQRLPHFDADSPPVSQKDLAGYGVLYWHVPLDMDGNWEQAIDQIATERSYRNRDIINVSKTGLGELYEAKIKSFFEEHMHEDEEIRYILDGAGFFDVRTPQTDQWIRVHLSQGDMLVLPAGIYHRFTLDQGDYIKAMRLFKDEPKWTPYNRSTDTDANHHRTTYLETFTP